MNRDVPLRVLVVTPFGTSSVTGGAEKWLLGMIANMPSISWHVLSLQDGPFCDELRAAGIGVSVRPTGASGIAAVRAACEVARFLPFLEPDVVIGNGVKAQLVIALATPLRGIPSVWVKHDYSYDSTLAGPLGCAADTVVTTAAEVGVKAGRDDLAVIHPPVQDEPICDRDKARSMLLERGIEFDDRPVLVMAGRLVPYKGLDDAIAGLAAPGGESWRLVAIGEEDHSSPGERDRLRRLAERLGVVDRVIFARPVQGLGSLFAAFDALAVLTKPTDRRAPSQEGFGMTAFEAMQAGIPVIAVKDSPVAKRLGGTAGIIVSPQSPSEIAVALKRLIDPATRAGMGEQGRSIVAEYANSAEVAGSFASVLYEAAQHSRWSGLRQIASRMVRKVLRRRKAAS